MRNPEVTIRKRIGVPENAQTVLILGETSHWDPEWLFTSEEYYHLRIRSTLNAVIRELQRDSKRVYAIESIFFLRLFWERNPRQRDTLRELMNRGRIILTGTGAGQPDTHLPTVQAILRDFQLGQQWLRDQGIDQEPEIANFVDNFEHTPGLPSLLNSLGFRYTSFWRLDGGFCEGSDFRPRSEYPLPGSTAELLLRRERSVDFVWRTGDGAEILCHYMSRGYGMGDDLTISRPLLLPRRWMGLDLGFASRSEGQIARRIQEYADHLRPLSRTGYLFCPMGHDFNEPLPRLGDLVDRFNERQYPQTGVYLALATQKDYFDLLEIHKTDLPVLEGLDPNPFTMACGSSRPEIKERCRQLSDDLVLLEKLNTLQAGAGSEKNDLALRQGWEAVTHANHHDFITGTSAERVVRTEQIPMLKKAQQVVDEALSHLPGKMDAGVALRAQPSPPRWEFIRGKLKVENDDYALLLDPNQGGCLIEWIEKPGGRRVLRGPGIDLVSYEDSGGLWRFPWEFQGGVWRELDRTCHHPCAIQAEEQPDHLKVTLDSTLDGRPIRRVVEFRGNQRGINVRVEGDTRKNRCILCHFPIGVISTLTMDAPAAIVERPIQKLFDPTIWYASSYVHTGGRNTAGLAMTFERTGSVGMLGDSLALVTIRNITKEKAGFKKSLTAYPTSSSRTRQSLRFSVFSTPQEIWQDQFICDEVKTTEALWQDSTRRNLLGASENLIMVDAPAVEILAVKKADHGEGIIVQLGANQVLSNPRALRFVGRVIKKAWLCTARERDIYEIDVKDGRAMVPLAHPIICVRIHIKP